MEPEKASARMKTKKTKMLMSFRNTFCKKNRQTQKFVLNLKIWKFEFAIWIWNVTNQTIVFSALIIKITNSSVLIGLKKAYFPLIRLPKCYRTVCYWIVCYRTVQKANHIQRCSLKQPIIFKVVITCACTCACFCVFAFFLFCFCILMRTFPFFHNLAIFLGNCNFYD